LCINKRGTTRSVFNHEAQDNKVVARIVPLVRQRGRVAVRDDLRPNAPISRVDSSEALT